jgi:argininosuccinate lyase
LNVRGRRLSKQSDDVTGFTSSIAVDWRIAGHVIRTNMAHMISLMESDEVGRDVAASCLAFLSKASATPGKHVVSEDFHQLLEQEAVDSLGVETAGYMNLGKSRNDQVATAIRMEVREQVLELEDALRDLQQSILNLVRGYGRTIIPGYTHLQRAQPVTVAHHFMAYFDSLQRDVERLLALYPRINLSPMGSAALAGTSVRLDRGRVARLLGFDGCVANALDAVSSRDFVLESISCATLLMLDLSRLSEEIILWSSHEFAFVELSDEYAASSSMMPQKKNPVVAEIIRAKSGSVLGRFVAVGAIVKALPYSYNLDLQETTVHLWPAFDDAIRSVRMMSGMLSTMKFNLHSINESMKADYSTATALANHLVKKEGISFRESHAVVGELVRISMEESIPFEEAIAERLPGVMAQVVKAAKKKDRRAGGVDRVTAEWLLDPGRFLSTIVTQGGSNPAFIADELESRRAVLMQTESDVSKLRASLSSSESLLLAAVRSATGVKNAKKREVKS